MSAWGPALDALDEWVRRTADGITAKVPELPADPPRMPGEAIPVDLLLRAQVLMAAMQDLETDVLRRRELLRRRQAYGAA